MASWARLADLPIALSEVGVAAVAGRVHVVGGTDEAGNSTTTHVAYDPRDDAWEWLAPLPRAMHHVAVVHLLDRMYAVGGLLGNVHLEPQDAALAYDPITDAWTELTPLPTPRGSVGAAAVGSVLHTFGGRSSDRVIRISPAGSPEVLAGIGTVTSHEIFDPVSGMWSPAPPLPGPPRDHMGVAELDGKVHVFGGRVNDYSDMLERHDVYDPSTKRWSASAPLPRPRSAGATTVLKGRIIYVGGECKPGGAPFTANAFDDVDAYNEASRSWDRLPPLPEGRHAFGAAVIGDTAYFAGGALLCGGGASTNLLALSLDEPEELR